MDISYIINHLGEERDQYFNAIAPPIIQTSNFVFDSIADFKKAAQAERENHLYTRGNNPTVEILAKKLAALQGSEDALVLSSGAGAISNAVIANVKAGDHVVCVKNAYSWANRLLMNTLTRFDISTTFVEGDKVDNFKNAIQDNTTIIYLESPSTLFFSLQDLEAISQKHPNFKYTIWASEKSGYLTANQLEVRDFESNAFLICGPATLKDSMSKQLKEKGVSSEHIYDEEFAFR